MKIHNKHQLFFKLVLSILILIITSSGCGDGFYILVEDTPDKYPQNLIVSFEFLADDNSELSSDVTGTISDSVITLTVPMGTDISNLKPDIQSTGETVSPESGIAMDFSEGSVIYTVTASDESERYYTVNVIYTIPLYAIYKFNDISDSSINGHDALPAV